MAKTKNVSTEIARLEAELEKARATETIQNEKIHSERVSLATSLPDLFGVPDMKSVIGFLRKLNRVKGRRTKVTDEIRADVIAALKADEMTGEQIANKFKLSVPTIQNIKKAAGLVKQRV